jgi:hypothetical protein
MRDTDAKHKAHCPSLRFLAGYETKLLQGVGIVVSKESATLDSDETKEFNEDHIDMVKPDKRTHLAYAWVKEGVKACVDGSSQCSNAPHLEGSGCIDATSDGFPLP